MAKRRDHISICICTYKRPELLLRLLRELQNQITEQLFTYSIVVVDNDYTQSAKSTFESFKEKSKIDIEYYNEPEQNIALARNKAVEKAKGNFIAFIDDDEFPVNTWLLNLYNAYISFKVDGIFGPVKPHFDEKPPEWLVKGKFCERLSHKTGTILNSNSCRTGNVLLNKKIFQDRNNRFGPEFGRTGGEDSQFFHKLIQESRVFIWCDEATVYETVPPERWKKSFYLKKFLRIGGLTGEKINQEHIGAYKYFIKVIIAFLLSTLALPFSFLFGKHVYMKCLIKAAYFFGCVSGFLGHVFVRYKND